VNIFKAKGSTIDLWRLTDWIEKHPFTLSETNVNKIGISWKLGKRRKLRSYTLSYENWPMDGERRWFKVKLVKGNKAVEMDNEFGRGSMHMNELETLVEKDIKTL
jgi:uncharacterized protein (UPF0128 family)